MASKSHGARRRIPRRMVSRDRPFMVCMACDQMSFKQSESPSDTAEDSRDADWEFIGRRMIDSRPVLETQLPEPKLTGEHGFSDVIARILESSLNAQVMSTAAQNLEH